MAPISYRRHRFPPVVIEHAVWLYLRFTLSYRDVEELLAERGLDLSYESVRSWVLCSECSVLPTHRFCSSRIAPTRRVMASSLEKMPTTLVPDGRARVNAPLFTVWLLAGSGSSDQRLKRRPFRSGAPEPEAGRPG